ncbi:MAG TPA: hypothetical protein VNN72_09145 [Polyangiaceae bacterium]|nr:hypothetical protein [Polyangiaceae bacterium]
MTKILRPSALLGACLVAVSLVVTSCASTPDAVLETGGMNLSCPRKDLEVALNRETPVVREYAVACNFMYTRVHCTKAGCRSAPLEPPCVANLPCFEEDPVTLEWRLPEKERLAYAAAHAAH